MDEGLIIVVAIVVPLAIVGLILWLCWKHEKKRRLAFEAIAAEMGLSFTPKGVPSEHGFGEQFKLFNRGRARKLLNIISGDTAEVDLAIFGYRFTTGSGKNSQTHSQSVIHFNSPNLALPEFQLGPEGFFSKIGQAFGGQDIDFDSHPEFSKRFLLRGPDEEAIRRVFTPQILEYFEPRAKEKLSIEARDTELIVYRAGKRIKPEQTRGFMQLGFEIYGLFKQA